MPSCGLRIHLLGAIVHCYQNMPLIDYKVSHIIWTHANPIIKAISSPTCCLGSFHFRCASIEATNTQTKKTCTSWPTQRHLVSWGHFTSEVLRLTLQTHKGRRLAPLGLLNTNLLLGVISLQKCFNWSYKHKKEDLHILSCPMVHGHLRVNSPHMSMKMCPPCWHNGILDLNMCSM